MRGRELISRVRRPTRCEALRLSRASARAFTLVEIMLVVILIGILTAMIIPEMKGSYEDALLRSTSRELLNACSLASSRAICLNRLHRVRLDRSGGRYFVESRVRKGPRQLEFVPVSDADGGQGALDGRISIQLRHSGGAASERTETAQLPPEYSEAPLTSPGLEAISFYPDGTADAAELLLRDRAGFQLVLRINPITARALVLEPERAAPSSP